MLNNKIKFFCIAVGMIASSTTFTIKLPTCMKFFPVVCKTITQGLVGTSASRPVTLLETTQFTVGWCIAARGLLTGERRTLYTGVSCMGTSILPRFASHLVTREWNSRKDTVALRLFSVGGALAAWYLSRSI
jgi:hypothetical protein